MSIPKAYLEHVAFPVSDIHWYIKFFHNVFGMTCLLYTSELPTSDLV